jgi:hypothetical protein
MTPLVTPPTRGEKIRFESAIEKTVSVAGGGEVPEPPPVCRGRTALDPLLEAVVAGAAVVGWHIDRAGRAALDDLSLDAHSAQRAIV